MSVAENIQRIRNSIPETARLVAVTKTQPPEIILEAYKAGHKVFGENKAQEMAVKWQQLPNDAEWHFIGHLQSNKVKYIAPFVHLIHSVDSLKLLGEINRQALKCGRIIPCLLQFHIATEETKFGLNQSEAIELLQSPEFAAMQNVRICGVMGMATFTSNTSLIRSEFRGLKASFQQLKDQIFADKPDFCEISMGMSDDYPLALEEGSTIIRVGSAIFGHRN
jgi:hypothetical protein